MWQEWVKVSKVAKSVHHNSNQFTIFFFGSKELRAMLKFAAILDIFSVYLSVTVYCTNDDHGSLLCVSKTICCNHNLYVVEFSGEMGQFRVHYTRSRVFLFIACYWSCNEQSVQTYSTVVMWLCSDSWITSVWKKNQQ